MELWQNYDSSAQRWHADGSAQRWHADGPDRASDGHFVKKTLPFFKKQPALQRPSQYIFQKTPQIIFNQPESSLVQSERLVRSVCNAQHRDFSRLPWPSFYASP